MTRRTKLTAAAVAMVCGAFLFVATLVHALWWAPEAPAAVATTTKEAIAPHVVSPGAPSTLRIPALNIRAHVQTTTLNARGGIGVPTNFTDVAWYTGSAMPGQSGTAFIDGHVDNGLGLAGVFKHLGDIKTGDDIYIDTKAGTTLHFVVSSVVSYPYQSVPMATILGAHNGARLVLVTCEGSWVHADRTYDHRLVVYAQLAQP